MRMTHCGKMRFIIKKPRQLLQDLLKDYCSPELVNKTLLETEIKNVPFYGYGIKSFGLSMIETALRPLGEKNRW